MLNVLHSVRSLLMAAAVLLSRWVVDCLPMTSPLLAGALDRLRLQRGANGEELRAVTVVLIPRVLAQT